MLVLQVGGVLAGGIMIRGLSGRLPISVSNERICYSCSALNDCL